MHHIQCKQIPLAIHWSTNLLDTKRWAYEVLVLRLQGSGLGFQDHTREPETQELTASGSEPLQAIGKSIPVASQLVLPALILHHDVGWYKASSFKLHIQVEF